MALCGFASKRRGLQGKPGLRSTIALGQAAELGGPSEAVTSASLRGRVKPSPHCVSLRLPVPLPPTPTSCQVTAASGARTLAGPGPVLFLRLPGPENRAPAWENSGPASFTEGAVGNHRLNPCSLQMRVPALPEILPHVHRWQLFIYFIIYDLADTEGPTCV